MLLKIPSVTFPLSGTVVALIQRRQIDLHHLVSLQLDQTIPHFERELHQCPSTAMLASEDATTLRGLGGIQLLQSYDSRGQVLTHDNRDQ